MKRQDQARIVRAMLAALKQSLKEELPKFPASWDGHQLRILFAERAAEFLPPGLTSEIKVSRWADPGTKSERRRLVRDFRNDCYNRNIR